MNRIDEYMGGRNVSSLEVVDISEIADGEPRVPYGTPSEHALADKKKKRIERISEEFLSIMPWVEFRLGELSSMRGPGMSHGFHDVKVEDHRRRVLITERINKDEIEYVDVIVNDIFGDENPIYWEYHEFFCATEPVRLMGSMTVLLSQAVGETLPAETNPLIQVHELEVGSIAGPCYMGASELGRRIAAVEDVQVMTENAKQLMELLEPLNPLNIDSVYSLGTLA